ncbi:MAG: hypothetical protein Kow00128_07960 [Deltaproteobacteria bacterium]
MFLLAVSVLGFGGSLQVPLAVLRAGAFAAAFVFLRRTKEPVLPVSVYSLLVAGFVVLSIGHSFSSVYFWVSFQHAVNVALAAVLMGWATVLFRKEPLRNWDRIVPVVLLLAVVQVWISLYQRIALGDPRPHGTFDNPNFLAEFLAAAAVLSLSRLPGDGGIRSVLRRETAAAVCLVAASLFLSGSRGVLLSLVPAMGAFFVLRMGWRRGIGILGFLGIPVLALAGWKAIARFSAPDIYNYGRWIMWKSAWRTFVDHPFGVGLGGYKYFWYATQSPVPAAFRKYGKFAHTAHSEYLEVLSGLGIVGEVLFLAVLAVPIVITMRAWRRIPEERRGMAAGAVGVLVLSGVHAAFDFNFHEFAIVVLDAAMLGALLSCLPREALPVVRLTNRIRIPAMVGVAALMLVAGATIAGSTAYDRGEDALKAGKLTEARRWFRLAAKADPFRATYPDALSAISFRTYFRNRPAPGTVRTIPPSLAEALQWEGRARDLSPRDYRYSLRLSQLFLELFRIRRQPADLEMALRLADGAQRIHPHGVEIHLHRAEILTLLGRENEAVAVLESAVSMEPNFCRGYATLAGLEKRRDPARAKAWSEKARDCREYAMTRSLEEYEQWLVGPPEKQ